MVSTQTIETYFTGSQPLENLQVLEAYIHELAQSHKIIAHGDGKNLLILEQPERYKSLLRQAQQHFMQTSREKLVVSLAGEWLLDNFYVVRQSLSQVLEDIQSGTYRDLPKLVNTNLEGYPRVYALARDMVASSEESLSLSYIEQFVEIYQVVAPLTIGELWALPAMLNLINLENLTYGICQLAGLDDLPSLPTGIELFETPATDALVAVSVQNLRRLAMQDWKIYFEAVSRVEHILRQDPAEVYAQMDFATRNLYRTEIETLAPLTGEAQEAVAHSVIQLAGEASGEAERFRHVGYYLIDEGRGQLEAMLGFEPPVNMRIARWLHRHAFLVYTGSISFLTGVVLALIVAYATTYTVSLTLLAMTFTLSLLPSSLVAVQVVNWIITRTVEPSVLPKMDYEDGVPPEIRTIIVIPALLTSEDEVDSLCQHIELHSLRNSDPNFLFALLLDYTDAQKQHLPEDETLREHVAQCMNDLNAKYPEQVTPRFMYFLRERRWNPTENQWMGWERKRGKLHEFNQLILNPESETSYSFTNADMTVLNDIRYVITLDADTVLPKSSARRMVATMAHPLNHPVFDEQTRTVVKGYAILQPRVEVMPTSANRTWFTRIFAGDTSLDLYTRAVSDAYQDWFGEGSYVGKGIYDVNAFEYSLAGRIPENRLLSHDLFESLHARTALVTDITLLEDYPPHFLIHMQRLHRWIRGDWQLLPWLLPNVPSLSGQLSRGYFTLLGYWKVIDNLRRSLMAPGLLLFLIGGWTILPGVALTWTLFFLLASGFPFLISPVNRLLGTQKLTNWRVVGNEISLEFQRWVLFVFFLPYEAYVSVHAIVTTLYRLWRCQNLLQWISAAQSVRLFGANPSSQLAIRQMRSSLTAVVVITLAIIFTGPLNLMVALPFLLGWAVSPYIAYIISQPIVQTIKALTEEQRERLRLLARRTWLFFEYYVGPQDNWLPPDHYQEVPREITAHHTSPSNIGLYLLGVLAAYDMGYIGLPEMATRLQLAFDSLDQVERHRGHLLNWYDTRTLRPLEPRYVSMVDSGNFAGSLITLQQGLKALSGNRPLDRQRWQGFVDTLDLLGNVLRIQSVRVSAIDGVYQYFLGIRRKVQLAKGSLADYIRLQNSLVEDDLPELNEQLVMLVNARHNLDTTSLAEIRLAIARIRHHLENMRRDTQILLPWATLMANPPAALLESVSTNMNEAWQELTAILDTSPPLSEAAQRYRDAQTQLTQLQDLAVAADPSIAEWCEQLNEALTSARLATQVLLGSFSQLQSQIETYLQEMDFEFLFNQNRKVFHIGYNVTNQKLDNSFYDLLASEARIGSLVAIALDQVPQEHWLHLGRAVTFVNGKQTLLSWSGTMFEYLMPLLFMRNYPNTLLQQTYNTVVNHQMSYRQHYMPWGTSESGYYAFDAQMNYQYRAFGTPDLALKYSLEKEYVISPYASLLALPLKPEAVMENIDMLESIGAMKMYGLIEAVDYTVSRLRLGQNLAHVYEYMAHHQGMILMSLANYLYNDIMVERFHSDPRIQSVELLLQEQIPRTRTRSLESADQVEISTPEPVHIGLSPWEVSVQPPVPCVHYLSNGDYGVLITSSGSGYSQWKSNALTRWRADTTLEDWGSWVYVCDADADATWSIGYQPVSTDQCKAVFHPHKAVFECRNQDIFAQMEITVSPEDDVEIRRIQLTNHSDRPRRLLLSSYSEIVMAPQDADKRHPAFNKMFIDSEYVNEVNTLLFHRRPRSAHESPFFVGHLLTLQERQPDTARLYETDRRQFIGRNRTIHNPVAFEDLASGFTGTTGMTLDPIVALGREMLLEAYATVVVAYVTFAADTRDKALELAQKYQMWTSINLAFEQSNIRGERELQRLEMSTGDLKNIQTLLSALVYPQPALRAPLSVLANNTQSQSGLWAYGISGDYPILMVNIYTENDLLLVRDLILAHTYWRNRQIKTTLVIINRSDTDYNQTLYNQAHRLITVMKSGLWLNRHDGIFIIQSDQIGDADLTLLAASARVFLDARQGSLDEQLNRLDQTDVYLPAFATTAFDVDEADTTAPLPRPTNLSFDNGFGGFAPDVMEYVIYREPGTTTPAPWLNVIANERAGFTVSETGGGFSWAINSGENRLTAWRNDPVIDMPSEIIYLRDEENGEVWSATPLPAGPDEPYLIRHGAGYTIFEHHSHALYQQLTLFVAPQDPVKIIKLRLENTADRTRRITATYYGEWVLGPVRDVTQQYLIPDFDQSTQALLVRNPYNLDFGDCYMFVSASKDFHGLTTDRTEFLGRLGRYAEPAALKRIGLAGRVEPGRDSCAAVQLHIDLPPGDTEDVYFIIGGGVGHDEALRLARQYRDEERLKRTWEESKAKWENILKAIEIKTPSESMNTILPWLLYQALSCRIWGRSALYQSSGAYGFRDQLQDVMSVVYARPDVAREHILRAAAHQFEAGDVLHWWHPPSGRGIRTRFSDDLLWLPYVTQQYVSATGDTGILYEEIPFKIGAPLGPDEDERYGYYESTSPKYTLYEHCLRAIERGFTGGRHDLPLMGSGDWNDGMNRVGIEGQGESVWVGWFIYETVNNFLSICQLMGDDEKVTGYRKRLDDLQTALEQHAWDGEWYRRAYYDDGTPLGSAINNECRIDSIAQSWGIISGAASPERATQAMQSLREMLIKTDDQLLLLFTPPFDETEKDPGYIKGYPPGVRENGGQYTHAAIWTVWAFAQMGEGTYAEQLFKMLNPILHADTPQRAEHYRVEPYVVAADVYSAPAYTGRGGWTWYTGSSGWLYRLGIEALLGIRREGRKLFINPCIPHDWSGFSITYRNGPATYHIHVENPDGVQRGVKKMVVDGEDQDNPFITLSDESQEHYITVVLGQVG